MLSSKRCLIKKIKRQDEENIKKLYTSEKVREYLGGIIDGYSLEKKINELIEKDNKCWKVVNKKTLEFIGLIGIGKHHDSETQEIFYEFFPEYWGKGYASESINEVIQYIFVEMKLPKILAETQLKNEKSIKLLKTLGFVFVKELERFGEKQGVFEIRKNSR